MESEDYRDLLTAFGLFWNGKIPEGDAFVRARLKRHPAFVAMLAEESVIISSLTEDPSEYSKSSQLLATAEKRVTALYKQHRPALKAQVHAMGKSAPSSATSSPSSSSSSAVSVAPESIQQLKEELRMKGQEVEEDSSADEPAVEVDLGIDDADEGPRLSASDPKFQVMSALFCKALIAEISLWSSLMLFKQRKYLKGVIDFRKAWKTYSEAADAIKALTPPGQETNPELPLFEEVRSSVDFGMGVFHFGVSSVPPAYRWIVEGFGFRGDREGSLKELERSSKVATGIRSGLSALMFSFIQSFFYNDHELACQNLFIQRERFPDAPIVTYTLGYIHRKEGNIPKSQEAFQHAKTHSQAIPEFQLKIDYEIGTNHYLLNEWRTALTNLEQYVNETKSEAFRAYCAFQVGFCYVMLDDHAKATLYMKKISGWYRKSYTFDEFANRHAKRYLKKKFTDFERCYHCALLFLEASQYESCLNYLQGTVQPFIKTYDDKSCWHYIAGTCLLGLKRFEDAKVQFNHSLKNEKKITSETQAIPFSYCGLAEVALAQGNLDEAESLAKKADGFSGYDFEAFLSWRTKKVLEDISKQRR